MGETSKQRGLFCVRIRLGLALISVGLAATPTLPAFAQPQAAVPSGTNIYIAPPPPADGCCESTDASVCSVGSFPQEKRYLIHTPTNTPIRMDDPRASAGRWYRNSYPGCPTGPGQTPECIEYYAYNVETTRRRAENLINNERNRACATFPAATRRSCDAAYNSIYQRVDEYFPYYVANNNGAVAPQTCAAGKQEMASLISYLAQSATQVEKLRQMMAAVNLAVTPDASNAVVYPQPDTEYIASKFLRMADGTLALGNNSQEKMRNVLSQVFERMARSFVAGSTQLTRDFPNIPYVGPEIKGYYQGFEPDLVNSKGNTILYISENPTISWCYDGTLAVPGSGTLRGIANPANWAYRWFRSSTGSYQELAGEFTIGGTQSMSVYNHQCRQDFNGGNADLYEGAVKAALGRGFIANLYMVAMQVLQENLQKGYIVKPPTFNLLDECSQKEVELTKMRRRVRASYAELIAGQSAGADHADCAEQVINDGTQMSDYLSNHANYNVTPGTPGTPGAAGSANSLKKVFGLQTRACVVASMQTQAEMQLALQYLYCTWRSLDKKFHDLVIQSLVTEHKPAPLKRNWAEKGRKEPSTKRGVIGASPFASIPSLFLMLGLLVSILGSSCGQFTDKIPMTCTGYRKGGGGPYRPEVANVCDEICKPLQATIADYQGNVGLAQADLAATAATYTDATNDPSYVEAKDKLDFQSLKLSNALALAKYDCKHNYEFTALEADFGIWVGRGTRRRVRRAISEANTTVAMAACQCTLRSLESGDQFGTGDPTYIFAQLSIHSRRQRSSGQNVQQLAMEGARPADGLGQTPNYSQVAAAGSTGPGSGEGGSLGAGEGSGGMRAGRFIEQDPTVQNNDALDEDLGLNDLDEERGDNRGELENLADLGQIEETVSERVGEDIDLADDANSGTPNDPDSAGKSYGSGSGSGSKGDRSSGPSYLASRDRSRKTASYGGQDFIASIGASLGAAGAKEVLAASRPGATLLFGGKGITDLAGASGGMLASNAPGLGEVGNVPSGKQDLSQPNGPTSFSGQKANSGASDSLGGQTGGLTSGKGTGVTSGVSYISDEDFERILGMHPTETLFSRATRVYRAQLKAR